MNVKKGYIKVPYVRLNKIFHLESFHWTFIPDSDVSKFQIFVKIRYLKKIGMQDLPCKCMPRFQSYLSRTYVNFCDDRGQEI